MRLRPLQNNIQRFDDWITRKRWWIKTHQWLSMFGDFMCRSVSALELRRKRQRLLLRALLSRRHLATVQKPQSKIAKGKILLFCVGRNEIERLPYFLKYYRNLGIDHFFFVDNESDDGSFEYLSKQPDVFLWSTSASYKKARFGLDWINWLLFKYGHGHWCLTVDVDEILIYPQSADRPIREFTTWLGAQNKTAYGTLMLDMYPKGRLGHVPDDPDDPFQTLCWFDAGPYSVQRQNPMDNLWIQGGPRARVFFADTPRKAPTLNKIPLVKWNRRFVYVNSTHSMLPRRLNTQFEGLGGTAPSGVLLHTKFLNTIVDKSREELTRKQHFQRHEDYIDYHQTLTQSPDLWAPKSQKFRNWQQLEELGLMSSGGWV